MDNKTLNNKLKERAVQLGLCAQWTSEWGKEETQDMLLKKYKKGIDFCIEHNYPNNEFIKANFSRSLLHENLIFVDEVVDMDGSNGVYIFNGKTNGTIRFKGYQVATLYIRHDCNLKIECSGNTKLFITLLDKASLSVIQSDVSKCYIYQKNEACKLWTKGEVLIRK